MILRSTTCLFMSLLLFGCLGNPGEGMQNISSGIPAGTQEPDTGNGQTAVQNELMENGSFPSVGADNATAGNGKDDLLLLGRSVSQGWADYMGLEWDDNGTMSGTYQGYRIRRYEVDSPPEIAASAARAMDEFDSRVVFFKLCFVDFGQDANESLAEDEQYVQQAYDEAVTGHGRKLIVGNALPQLAASSGEGLRYNHREYNKWLNNFTSTHRDVYVLDLYGMLSDSDGDLRSDYAVSSDDSHLNDKGYAAITPELMKLLAQAEAK